MKLSLSIALLSILFLPSISIAVPPNFGDHKNAAGNMFFGGTPGALLDVTISGPGYVKSKIASPNACGLTILTTNSLAVVYQGAEMYDPAILATATIPSCNTATGVLSEPRATSFKSDGKIVVVGGPVNGNYQWSQPKTKKLTIGVCGWAVIKNSITQPFVGNNNFKRSAGDTTNYGFNDFGNNGNKDWQCLKNIPYIAAPTTTTTSSPVN
jgi:hypothetical protein